MVQLFHGQDLLSAVASYIEVCFVFQEYSKPWQTVFNLVQLKICGNIDHHGLCLQENQEIWETFHVNFPTQINIILLHVLYQVNLLHKHKDNI